ELADRFLLERGGDERRGGLAPALAALDLRYLEPPVGELEQPPPDLRGVVRVADAELLEFLSVQLRQARREPALLVLEVGLDGPVFASLELLYFLFALDDQPQRGTLHAPGGEAAPDLLPQQRRQVEPHEVVQRAARLLRVDEL